MKDLSQQFFCNHADGKYILWTFFPTHHLRNACESTTHDISHPCVCHQRCSWTHQISMCMPPSLRTTFANSSGYVHITLSATLCSCWSHVKTVMCCLACADSLWACDKAVTIVCGSDGVISIRGMYATSVCDISPCSSLVLHPLYSGQSLFVTTSHNKATSDCWHIYLCCHCCMGKYCQGEYYSWSIITFNTHAVVNIILHISLTDSFYIVRLVIWCVSVCVWLYRPMWGIWNAE